MNTKVSDEQMKQYFFDISDIVLYLSREHFYSGIQRATVMIIEQCAKSMTDRKVYLSFYKPETQNYHTIPYTQLPPGTLNDPAKLRRFLNIQHPSRRTNYKPLSKYNNHPGKMWFHSLKFKLNHLAGNENHFRKHNSTSAEWKQSRAHRQKPNDNIDTVPFFNIAKQGDSLVLLDATWNFASIAAIFQQARDKGLNVHSLIHDLIPILAPEYSNGGLPLAYHDWLIKTSAYTSIYIANSRCTAKDLQAFLKAYDIERPIRVVPLAQAGLPEAIKSESPERALNPVQLKYYPKLHQSISIHDQLRSVLRQPYVLCVGTMEVRKNIWKVAQVWERLRQTATFDIPRLVFAGRAGWLTQDFDNFMKMTGNLYGWIDIFDSPSDDELSFLYRNCLFTITASMYEGWGLPIGEGLSYGKTGVVSETSSMPEVGGDLVEYCNPESIDSIQQACLKLIMDSSHREQLEKRIKLTRLRGWGDVANDLLAAIATEAETQSSPQDVAQSHDEGHIESASYMNVLPLNVASLRQKMPFK